MTPRKLERWRQRGLIPRTIPSRGGERGSASSYPEGTAAQVAELAGMLASDNDLDRALLRLFMRRYPVRLEPLRQLYLALFAAMGSLDAPEKPLRGRAARSGIARTVHFRLRRLASPRLPANELLRSVFAEVLEAYQSGGLGLEDDWEGSLTNEVKAATGIDRAEADVIHEGETLLPEVAAEELERSFGAASQRSVENTLRRATMPALERARDQWRHVLRLLADFGDVASSAAGRRRDIAGLEAVRKLADDELLTAVFVPFWLAALAMMKKAGVEIDPLWDPESAEGREHREWFDLLARLARSARMPVTNDTVAEALAAAPEELKAEFAAWLDRSAERTVIA